MRAQTTTQSPTTTEATTSTTRAATTTTRASTTTTTRRAPNRLTFTASPAVGPPGTNVTVSSTNPCTHAGNLYVLLSIGQYRLGSGAPDSSGNWRFTVTVPQVNVGTYGLSATCLISRNGVDENAGIYTGPEYTVTAGSGGPAEATTPTANETDNTALIIGLIVAVVVAIAAIAYAIWQHRKHKKETAPEPAPAPRQPPPDTFA